MKVNRVMIDEKGIEFSTVRLVELTSECVNDIADAVVQKMQKLQASWQGNLL